MKNKLFLLVAIGVFLIIFCNAYSAKRKPLDLYKTVGDIEMNGQTGTIALTCGECKRISTYSFFGNNIRNFTRSKCESCLEKHQKENGLLMQRSIGE